MKKRIKIQGFLILSGLGCVIFFYRYLIPLAEENSLRKFLDIIGIILVLAGYLLRISSRGVKAELNPDGKQLVQKGPYALTRNPMYLGTLFIGMGFIAFLFRWWVSVIFLVIYLAIYIPQIKREEEKLSGFFGDVFREYRKKTPGFFPSLIKLLSTNPGAYLQIKQAWVKKELPSFIATAVLMAGIKILIYLQF